jgi:predicted Fe-S protein YdhL (DUF1289 family)
MNAASPCNGICRLDREEICVGCFRTRAEIGRWTQLNDVEKSFVLAARDGRRKNVAATMSHESIAF